MCIYFSTDGTARRPDTFSTEAGSNQIAVLLKRKP